MVFLNFPAFECHDETQLTPIRMPSGHSTSAHDRHSLSVESVESVGIIPTVG